MAINHGLPEEILLTIFKQIEPNDVKQCQHVCPSWYSAAHCVLLKDIRIRSCRIEQFIQSIDSNPKDSYLKAVKSICITKRGRYFQRYRLTQQVVEKLFCRFSNLESVKILDDTVVYDDFDDDLCKRILAKCSLLADFEVDVNNNPRDYNADAVHKLRLLLTRIGSPPSLSFLSPQDVVRTLTSFPRLSYICSLSRSLDTFQRLLPVMTKLSNVNKITFRQTVPDEDDFVQNYLATISKEQGKQLVDNLSHVKSLIWICGEATNVNSLKFISKYFTKLKTLDLRYNPLYPHLSAALHDAFYRDVINLVCSVDDDGKAVLRSILYTDLEQIMSVVVPKFFNSTHRNKLLEICISIDRLSGLSVESNNRSSTRMIKMYVQCQLTFDEVATNIFSASAPIINVDQFILDVNWEYTIPMDVFNMILEKMPSLKYVVLRISRSCTLIGQEQTRTYPNVETLKIETDLCGHWQVLLDGFGVNFPNLKNLHLFYSCESSEKLSKFQIDLANYALERFILDTEAITEMWRKRYGRKKDVFIVAQVDQELYKISIGSPPTCTRTTETDLQGFTLGRHYVKVDVIVGVLKRFEVSYGARDGYLQDACLTIVYDNTS